METHTEHQQYEATYYMSGIKEIQMSDYTMMDLESQEVYFETTCIYNSVY